MLEMIDEVLKAEKEADELVQKARDEANRKQNEFATEESSTIKAAREESDRRLREEIAAIREEQARRVAQAEDRVREGDRELSSKVEARIDDTVRRAVEVVVNGG